MKVARSLSILLIALAPFAVLAPAFSAPVSPDDAITAQAIALFKESKLQDAVELEEKVSKENPKNWLPHATLSFFYWQQGNAPDAVTEGQKAARYAPDSEL